MICAMQSKGLVQHPQLEGRVSYALAVDMVTQAGSIKYQRAIDPDLKPSTNRKDDEHRVLSTSGSVNEGRALPDSTVRHAGWLRLLLHI